MPPASIPAGRILQNGRAKALRPIPVERRAQAFAEGLAAFARGDFFEAHELLEPAWMGSDDLTERELEQGLIKLAAAYVHAVRGNARGVSTNLVGARERLARVAGDGRLPEVLARLGSPDLDVAQVLVSVERSLDRLGPPAGTPEAGLVGSAARKRAARAILRRVPPPALEVAS